LRVLERTDFNLAVLAFLSLHGLAHSYFADALHHMADLEWKRQMTSSSSSAAPVVPMTQRSTIDDRAFPAVGSLVWNGLTS
jgi:hypothetical protein